MLLLTFLRRGRRLSGGVLLGLLLALLPLRGLAEAAMHLSAPATQSAAGESSLSPCHAGLAQHEGTAPDEADGGCSLCSLCHGSALCMSQTEAVNGAAASPAPSAVPQGHGPPALPLPERPPRA